MVLPSGSILGPLLFHFVAYRVSRENVYTLYYSISFEREHE